MILQKCIPALRSVSRRSYSLWNPYRWSLVEYSPLSRMMDRMERDFRDMERSVFNGIWAKPIAIKSSPNICERFHFEQPIVEEDGKIKFKLVFDVSHFKPEEITVKTSKGKVLVQGKHESKTENNEAKYEYFREYTIPEGVKTDEMTCKYTENGSLLVEAPYTPPPKVEKEKEIPISHE